MKYLLCEAHGIGDCILILPIAKAIKMADKNAYIKVFTSSDKNKILINKSIMDNVCGPIEHVYIDLSILKDVRLGLMMKLADPVLKQYLLDGLSNYNLRATRTFLEKYPKFVTE